MHGKQSETGGKAHRNRDYFYKLLQEGSFKDAVEKVKMEFMILCFGEIGVKNYGSELTYYALYQVLSDLNYNVLMVERPKTAVWGPNEGTPYSRQHHIHPMHAMSCTRVKMK